MAFDVLLVSAGRNWWTLLIRGIVAVIFALMAFFWPLTTLSVLVLLWGAFAIVDGVFAIVAGARTRWWSVLLFGVLGVLAGLVALLLPGITALVLLIVIGAWAIARGIFEIVAAIRLRRELTGEWILVVSGIVSIALGSLMVLFPGAGALALVWLIGLQALVAGMLMLALAFRLRQLTRSGAGAGLRANA